MGAEPSGRPSEHQGFPTGRRLAGAGLGVVLAVSVCSCSATRGTSAQRTAAVPIQTVGPTQGPAQPSAAGTDQGATDFLPSQLLAGPATPDPAAAADAVARAAAFLVAFARTDLPQEQWWAGIAPYFTSSVAEVYHWTDVRNVTVRGVEAPAATLLPASTRYRAPVAVPAADGTWTVTLIRVGSQWQVERAVPPDGRS